MKHFWVDPNGAYGGENPIFDLDATEFRLGPKKDALIHSLLDAGLSFREVARIAKCSHGSVLASKKELLTKKA